MPELLILAFFLLAVVGLVALVDIARRPPSQFAAAGQSRTIWLILSIVSIVVPCLFLASGSYLFLVHPKLSAGTA